MLSPCLFNLYSELVQLPSCVWVTQPHGLQHARLSCPSLTFRPCANPCPSSQWCHPTILSYVIPFSSCLQSFPASGSFPVSEFFTSSDQSIGAPASASVLPVNIQNWFPLGWAGWISLQYKGFSRVFSNTTVQKQQELVRERKRHKEGKRQRERQRKLFGHINEPQ